MNIIKKDILALDYQTLQTEIQNLGFPKFRTQQIYQWFHQKLADDFSQMTNLSKDMQAKLDAAFYITKLEPVKVQKSSTDGTVKYLFALADENLIETVLMPYHHGHSICISSQVGCGMGCRFCASTIGGKVRNLTTSEMLSQVYQVQKLAETRIANVVIMGTGEPLDNYENFVAFIKMVSDEKGLHISKRNITASTCGIVPGILALAQEDLPITLALSLHGGTQEKRAALMPIANRYPLEEVLSACDTYFTQTGRRVTYEYSLLGGVNDQEEDAKELIKLLRKRNCHLNLIPVNPIKERDFVKPNHQRALNFKNKLEKSGINVTIRREMGSDIDGACGQLRHSHMEEKN